MMFDHYPKVRKPLPPEYQAIFKKHFDENRGGFTRASGVSSKMEGWMHRWVAKDVQESSTPATTLELGAGGLNQLPYEPDNLAYDVVEPYTDLIEISTNKNRIRNFYKDIFEIKDKLFYQRITSVAVLEHLEYLPRIVAKSGLLLDEKGSFRAGIPNEGTVLWKLGYSLTTGLEFRRRYQLNYDVIMQHEHVNTADEIEEVLEYFFKDVSCRVLGLSKNFAFYRFYDCRKPNKNKCRDYLESALSI